MKAQDIMTTQLITVLPDVDVKTAASTMACNGISALPVLDNHGRLIGIVSEGDLVRRAEIKTERHRSWWLELFASDQTMAAEYVKSHAKKVRDVMTKDVVTALPDTRLSEIARLFENHHIKRVPIVERDGKVIGIVSRSNLVQAFANTADLTSPDETDAMLRREVMHKLAGQPWSHRPFSVHVRKGNVDLMGMVYSQTERDAIRVAAETTPGVASVTNHLGVMSGTFYY